MARWISELLLLHAVFESCAIRRDSGSKISSVGVDKEKWSWTSHCIALNGDVCMQSSGFSEFRLKYFCRSGEKSVPLVGGACNDKGYTCPVSLEEYATKQAFGKVFTLFPFGLRFYASPAADGSCETSKSRSRDPLPRPSPSPAPGPSPLPSPSPPPEPPPLPSPSLTPEPPSSTVVGRHGRLGTQGNKVVDEKGRPVRLRGMSMFWSQWFSQWWNADVVRYLVKDWKIQLIRAAMGVEDKDGYLTYPDIEKAKVEKIIAAAVELGIYVIVDWHSHKAEYHVDEAKAFFDEMGKKYGRLPNIIWETYNEPLQVDWSTVIKPYHDQVVPVIRQHSQNLISLGTRTWSQEVDTAANDPVRGSNLAYTVHFYCGQNGHREELRQRVRTAMNRGKAVFATEWGVGYEGIYNFIEAQTWLDFLAKNGISDANWAVNNKDEMWSAFKPGSSPSSVGSLDQLTRSGEWVRKALRDSWSSSLSSSSSSECAADGEDCKSSRCCKSPGKTCYQKDASWASCRESCTPNQPWEHDAPEFRTPWSCAKLSKASLPPPPEEEEVEDEPEVQPDPTFSSTPVPAPTPPAPTPPAPTPPAPTPPAPSTSPVAKHGQLSVRGSKIVDKAGKPVQLQGMSLFWSQWGAKYWNANAVKFTKDNWGATLVRAAMGVEAGGYLSNQASEKAKVKTVVEAAIAAGIYVIIDWHDHHAEKHTQAAKAFFEEMASQYGKYPNVIFETYNEPVDSDWSSAIKPYHEQIIPVIRRHSQNIILLGTKKWCQEIDQAVNDPVRGDNLAYVFHFYAATHGEWLRSRVRQAMDRGKAVFASEWGTCEASGNGALSPSETQAWLNFMAQHKISHANWALNDKREACSALQFGANPNGGWTDADLTPSGLFIRGALQGGGSSPSAPNDSGGSTGCAASAEDCRASKCCQEAGKKCYEKNQWWAGCLDSCTPGIHEDDPVEHQTPWTCTVVR
eukprot:TRINITY_DN6261_c0_g1_i2.p1 TRINITY_DN6261_c0_g1~~TRINITY_DN6261_c0_g1_i2.p1  ORF type:complete len:961 (+),score=144.68 TRINITY_DN6261_c0_g1_i2:43-2925(+)